MLWILTEFPCKYWDQNSARVLELAERLGKSDEREKVQSRKIRDQAKQIEVSFCPSSFL